MNSTTLTPAEVFPAGEYLRGELDARGWSDIEFAQIIGRPAQVVSEIINGKKEITAETAVAIADALGTSAELWLGLQTATGFVRCAPVGRRSTPSQGSRHCGPRSRFENFGGGVGSPTPKIPTS